MKSSDLTKIQYILYFPSCRIRNGGIYTTNTNYIQVETNNTPKSAKFPFQIYSVYRLFLVLGACVGKYIL